MLNWIQSFFKNSENHQSEAPEQEEKSNNQQAPVKPTVSQHPNNLNEVIQLEAYYLWERDGKPEGKADYYWQKASESVLNANRTSPETV